MNDFIKKQDVLDLCNSKDPDYKLMHLKEDVEGLPSVSAEYIAHEVWKCGYINGYNKSQKEAYEKGKEVGKEEMYRQMTGTLA